METWKTKLAIYPRIITLVGALLMITMLFFPYASTRDIFKTYLVSRPEDFYNEELEITNAQAINLSLAEFFIINIKDARENGSGLPFLYALIILIFTLFIVLTALMALLKLPFGVLLFDLISLAIFVIIQHIPMTLAHTGLIPDNSYSFEIANYFLVYKMGIVNYLIYIIGSITLAGAVWMFIEKIKAKGAKEKTKNLLSQEDSFPEWKMESNLTPAPAPMHAIVYHVAVNGQAAGPYNLNTLKQMAVSGQFNTDSLVWKKGMDNWEKADSIYALKEMFEDIPPIPQEK